MEINEQLRAALAAADENYLIGLTNKGTVNRAKKDLEKVTVSLLEAAQQEAAVQLGDVQCKIRYPLANSTCSCPSSALCRHRISAILWLKDNLVQSEKTETIPEFTQLRSYPAQKLLRELTSRKVAVILDRFTQGNGPSMEVSSVIAVDMPWIPAKVNLLEPLEHSTCSCRSKKWCSHKSEALLFWQLRETILSPADIHLEEETPWDLEAVRTVSRSVQTALLSLMAAGLNRADPGFRDNMERLISQCHTARLPDLERALRQVSSELNAYFYRSATYRDSALMGKIARAYRLARGLETGDHAQISQMAGCFRDEYDSVGDLKLYLLGIRRFYGSSGYGGCIYYFKDREATRYFTFRNIRAKQQSTASRRMGDPSPWNLPCTLNQAWNQNIDLTGARINREGNLSASEQTGAVLRGRVSPWDVVPESELIRDFRELFDLSGNSFESQRLALIKPEKCTARPFDTVNQVYSMILEDSQGRDLWLEVKYNRDEASVVSMMEALEDDMVEPEAEPVFFGSVYRDGDKLKLYPIECYLKWRDSDDRDFEGDGELPF